MIKNLSWAWISILMIPVITTGYIQSLVTLFGKQAVISWEKEMKNQGYRMTLISTQVDEGAQHLYRKLGYIDCGGLVLDHTPFDQPMEMFFRKVL